MRLLKTSPEGPPALVFVSHEDGMTNLWIGPFGLHIAFAYCGKWREHRAVSSRTNSQPGQPQDDHPGRPRA